MDEQLSVPGSHVFRLEDFYTREEWSELQELRRKNALTAEEEKRIDALARLLQDRGGALSEVADILDAAGETLDEADEGKE